MTEIRHQLLFCNCKLESLSLSDNKFTDNAAKDFAAALQHSNCKLESLHLSYNNFEVQPRKSSRHPAIYVTDLDFGDDLAIVTEDVQHAQELRRALEDTAAEVGLIINCKKTKVLPCGKIPPFSITLRDDSPIEHVSDFKYLGSWTRTSDKDISLEVPAFNGTAITAFQCHG